MNDCQFIQFALGECSCTCSHVRRLMEHKIVCFDKLVKYKNSESGKGIHFYGYLFHFCEYLLHLW